MIRTISNSHQRTARPFRIGFAVAAAVVSLAVRARAQTTDGLGRLESIELSISPDGRYAAYWTFDDNRIHWADRDSGFDMPLARGYDPKISAAGQFVAYYKQGDPYDHHPFVRDVATGIDIRLSGTVQMPSPGTLCITPDGRFVAFEGLTSVGSRGIYVHDRDADGNGVFDEGNETIELVSVDLQGNPAGSASHPAMSADGSKVAFTTDAPNLVANDANNAYDVFVHDRTTGETRRVSEGVGGIEGNGDSGGVLLCSGHTCSLSVGLAISADGRIVSFASVASNLVPGDTNGFSDVFTANLITGTVQLVSHSSSGAPGDADSGTGGYWITDCCGGAFLARQDGVDLSADGRFIAFASLASNLVSGDHKAADVFVHDRLTGSIARESLTSSGDEGSPFDGYGSAHPRIAHDGSHLIFYSEAALDPNAPTSRAMVRSRLAGSLIGTPAAGHSIHFELQHGNADRVGDLAIVLLSCTGVAPLPLPGGITLYLTFDGCTIAGLGLLSVLSAPVDITGTAATPPVVFPPGVPPGLTIDAAFITADQHITAAVDPTPFVTQ